MITAAAALLVLLSSLLVGIVYHNQPSPPQPVHATVAASVKDSAQAAPEGIWKQAQQAIEQSAEVATYEQVQAHLSLLTAPENVTADPQNPDTLIIAGGYITISPISVRSFAHTEDATKPLAQPEFEYFFAHNPSHELAPAHAQASLVGLRIALDIIPTHPMFKEAIGGLNYESFVVDLEESLKRSLMAQGADVSLLRPAIQLNADTVDMLNKNPPHIVISTQFNNDHQNDAVTFVGGNILKKDFASDRQRARFIESALTGKSVYSASLGAYVAHHFHDDFNLHPLAWQKASFEGNTRPVDASQEISGKDLLTQEDGNLLGIASRNTIQNGVFAKAFVAPFPDMQWVREQVQVGHEMEWIDSYAKSLTAAVLDFVANTPVTSAHVVP